LIAALPLGDAEARKAVTEVLGEIGDVRAVEPLVAALHDGDAGVRDAVAGALGRIGAPAVGPLIAALGERDANVRGLFTAVLVGVGAPAVEPLVAALGNWDGYVRWAAAEALGRIGDTRAVEPLVVALNRRQSSSGDKEAGAAAAAALHQIGEPAIELLVAALADQYGCSAAADALDKLGWIPDDGVAGATYWAARGRVDECVRIGSPAVEPLIAILRFEGSWKREVAAGALGQIGDARAVEPLVAALEDRDGELRGAAAWALGQIGDVRAIEPLIAGLEHREVLPGTQDARTATVAALVRFGALAVGPLAAAAGRQDESVRRYASQALGEIGDVRTVEALIGALEAGDQGADAARALFATGDLRAVGLLVAALRSGGPVRGRSAAEALDRLGWTPEDDEARVAYWVAKADWDKAFGDDALAFEVCVAALTEAADWGVRKAAAERLLTLYRSGQLGEAQAARLLDRRDTITRDHEDGVWSSDVGEGTHEDRGIGVDFPV